MPSLQVRELPENIYLQLCREAEKQHRSIAQQAVALLARGLNLELDPKSRRVALLAKIKTEPINLKVAPTVDPAQLIREDRER
jgi:plasmid stability protein